MTTDIKTNAVDTAEIWAGVSPPNAAAEAMAADLREAIAAFEALRGRLRFEDEPSDFEAALHDMKESV
ncbi:DUF2460 domain-containing protein [Teichococcus vastitatis]|uniref:DUF2460 domain-containing protein n=1 Tax=Teichococcus vastitatis TaxID=2307076 RepID=A0ABS9W6X7_9PROT|nr:DUF2460 domain-containing protein [Pseudoroseomonas vastitatis]MCI0755047.1 DUF2460 domain-containing protein [Pseudoroseomonas vastitatis]